MASYKIEIIKKFGTYRGVFYSAKGTKPSVDDAPELKTIEDVMAFYRESIKNLTEDDSVFFRGIAHTDFVKLEREIKMATY